MPQPPREQVNKKNQKLIVTLKKKDKVCAIRHPLITRPMNVMVTLRARPSCPSCPQ